MTGLRRFAGVSLVALMTTGAFAQTISADEFGQAQAPPTAPMVQAPECPPVAIPQPIRKRVTTVEAIKGGAELGALIGGLTGHKKGVLIGTVAGGVAGLLWERTAAKHAEENVSDAVQ